MRNFKYKWFSGIIFIMVFIILSYGLAFALVPKGNYSRMTMREMYSDKKDFDVVFAGASLSNRDINPYIMDKELGVNTFNYAFSQQMFVGTYYSLKEMFNYHKPKLIVLTVDPDNFTSKEEKPIVFLSVSLYMKSFLNKLEYYFASSQDGSYLDRLFPWRGYDVKSPLDVVNNIYGKFDSFYTDYPKPGQVEAMENNKNGYVGKGFVKVDPSDEKGTLNYDNLKLPPANKNISDINTKDTEYLKKISQLCKENNCELILLSTPFPTFQILRVKNYFEFDKKVADIAKDLNIEYYNYNLIKPEVFKLKNNYFSDTEHLNTIGAEAFSKSLAAFVKKRQNGDDMSKYFYKQDEYYASIDYVSSAWFNWKKNGSIITLSGDSLHGSKVTPEYQFVLLDSETGQEHIIRDYDKNPDFVFDSESYKKFKIRVNARAKGSNNNEVIRHYDEDVSKEELYKR